MRDLYRRVFQALRKSPPVSLATACFTVESALRISFLSQHNTACRTTAVRQGKRLDKYIQKHDSLKGFQVPSYANDQALLSTVTSGKRSPNVLLRFLLTFSDEPMLKPRPNVIIITAPTLELNYRLKSFVKKELHWIHNKEVTIKKQHSQNYRSISNLWTWY